MSNRAEAERLAGPHDVACERMKTYAALHPERRGVADACICPWRSEMVATIEAALDSAREEGRREERENRESVWLANVAQIEAQAYARGVEAMQDAIVQELASWSDTFRPSIMKDVSREACSRAALVALVPEAGREGK